jgi:hypothetical protein
MPDAGVQDLFGKHHGRDSRQFAQEIEKLSQDGLAVGWARFPLPLFDPQNIDEFDWKEVGNEDMDHAGFQTLKQRDSLIGILLREEQLEDHVRVNDEPALKSCHAASSLGQALRCRFRGHIAGQWIRV